MSWLDDAALFIATSFSAYTWAFEARSSSHSRSGVFSCNSLSLLWAPKHAAMWWKKKGLEINYTRFFVRIPKLLRLAFFSEDLQPKMLLLTFLILKLKKKFDKDYYPFYHFHSIIWNIWNKRLQQIRCSFYDWTMKLWFFSISVWECS